MSKQKIVWTALPNGLADGGAGLRLSVFVSPRLMPESAGETTLEAFPDWWDWPSTKLTFQVDVNTPQGVRTLPVVLDPASPAPDSSLWGALFPHTTPVAGYTYKPLDGLQLRSYHALGLHNWLKDRYQTVAVQNATNHPPVSILQTLLDDIRYEDKPDSQMKQSVLAEPFPPAGELFSAHKDFFRFQVFHKPFSKKPVPIQLPQMDFHAIVGALARYPALLRQLGFVYDLIIERGEVPLPVASTLRVVPSWEPVTTTENVRPLTHYTMSDANLRVFAAQPRPAQQLEYVTGKLPLGDLQRYGVIQLDVDGLAFKALDLASNLNRLAVHRFARPLADYWLPQKPAAAAALPSGSTGGLAVVKNYRAAYLHDLLAANTLHNAHVDGGSGDSMELYLEDLIRGHRIDVWDEVTDTWHSLHKRDGTYTIDGSEISVPPDEGWAMTSTASPVDPAAPQELRLHESVAEWAGWSLSASRPESTIGTRDEIKEGPDKPAGSNFKLQVTFKPVGGSLPRLRFGRKYRLRVRAVDLAGNGPALDESPVLPEVVSPDVRYQRYEPITQPVLIPRTEYKESESVEHLVVRSWTTPPADKPATEITERHVAPPSTTVRMAEMHGQLDDPAGPGGFRADAYTLLTGLEGFAPSEPAPESRWTLTYLCDPLAHGAAFAGLPGAGTVLAVPFDTQAWPHYRPFRLKVIEGDGAPGPDLADPDAFVVQLPKAVVAPVRISCYPTQAELEKQLGIWRWLMESFTSDPDTPPGGNPSYNQLLKLALAGQHWMVTPYREILLIHAVQQPLLAPQFTTMGVARDHGVTWADIRYVTPIDGKSTQKLDVTATWSLHVDPLGKQEPEVVDGSAHAFTTPVDPNSVSLQGLGRHEFGDTKHRLVHYKGIAMTRFPEFFPEGTTPLTRTTDETTGDRDLHIPSTARPDVPDVLYVLPAFEWVPGVSGSTSIMTRKGNALRIYLNRPWYSSGDDEKLGVILNVRPVEGTWPVDVAREIRWKYQSGWAEDPTVTSAPTPPALTPDRFSLALPAVDGYGLAEVPGSRATVVPHEVAYDVNQGLWYCDVRIEPAEGYTPYMPFVRLALARYQPYSINDVHLSRIALADFAQLTPDRTVSITPGAKKGDYNISLVGLHAHVKNAAAPFRRVEATVERRQQTGDDFGWAPVGNPVPLTPFAVPNLYLGSVHIPPGADVLNYRLVFKEYEKLLADPDDRATAASKEIWRLVFAHDMPFAPIM
ncbi:MAG TPA: hypothetical protein VD969_24175 [Symbiobacteriaceae bacterium]|nr:hypothetical protein [Symbiobacteriaceae bacterium]